MKPGEFLPAYHKSRLYRFYDGTYLSEPIMIIPESDSSVLVLEIVNNESDDCTIYKILYRDQVGYVRRIAIY